MSIEITRLNRLFAILVMWVVAYQVTQIIKSRNLSFIASWIKASSADLSTKLGGELSIEEVGNELLQFLEEKTDSKVSALYSSEDSKNLNFVVGRAFRPEEGKEKIQLGEGFLGKAAAGKNITVLNNITPEHFKIITAFGESSTASLTIVPLISNNKSIGAIELGHMADVKDYEVGLFEEIRSIVTSAIKSAQYKQRLNDLLQEAQQYSEELQVQQEELRSTNEELEQQAQNLRATHARLENQQAEMEQTNQQLEEQTQTLETQKGLLNERNKDLIASQKELENTAIQLKNASQYKSEFLANMSHELRTPLNSTLILAKLLSENKKKNLTDEQIKYAETIYRSGNDLLNLINDILDLSKVEAGKMLVNPEIIDLESLIVSMELLFRPIANDKKIDFKLHIENMARKDIITDRTRLEQILKNFLSNAFKFTAKGSVSFSISSVDNLISFSITDTGIGIAENEQEVIFEAFRQADGTTNRKFGGTGLGLSISKELAGLLNGEIKVASQKSKGSTFTLLIPRVLKQQTDKKEQFKRAPVIDISAQTEVIKDDQLQNEIFKFSFEDDRDNIHEYGRKMLIIEDDEEFAKILFDLAHEMNFGAIISQTCEEAIALAKHYRPNAIVLDLRLPDHSGMIVLDNLKMNPGTRHIPIHIISSSDFSRSALEMGAAGYILKPVKRDQLLIAFQNISSKLDQKLKRVLVVEDEEVQRNHIFNLLSDHSVEVDAVESSTEALEKLTSNTYDCMIMDLSLPDMSGYELLSKISKNNATYSFPPVIIYTARDLTKEEEERLRLYSGSIIIKGAKSPERLLSEVTLFLHRVETDLPVERQKMLSELRSRDKALEDNTILIVDDDIRNIFALTSALESFGANIEVARNGLEAIEKVNSLPQINLVLMDIMMPEMDGHEATREIRKLEKFKDLPIIALTAKAMKDDRDKCLEAGANDYLAKPLDIDKLLSLIRIWLPQKRTFTK